jgi:hypothetical protein
LQADTIAMANCASFRNSAGLIRIGIRRLWAIDPTSRSILSIWILLALPRVLAPDLVRGANHDRVMSNNTKNISASSIVEPVFNPKTHRAS